MTALVASRLPAPSVGNTAELRARCRDGKAALIAGFMASRSSASSAGRLLRALARHVDGVLVAAWAESGLQGSHATLVAVGGYGRGELFPHSDVDVLVLMPDASSDAADAPGADDDRAAPTEALERFVTLCWDIGLEIGSSVRTVSECLAEAARDVTVQTALLESRRITGARQLHGQLTQALAGAMDPAAFLRAKTLEMQQRHVKYQGTPYALEPNCKESPGGLRDLQVVIWVARAAGYGRTWAELAAGGLITPFEASQLLKHEGTLRLIRARLHAVAGRREDRLVFDLQTAVADSFGLEPSQGQRSSEALERFVTLCWDIGLEIGSSVRTVSECLAEAARDVTVQTALLESRRITGARQLHGQLTQALAGAMDPAAFLRAKTLEMQQRHVK